MDEISIIKDYINKLSSPIVNINNEAVQFLEDWKNTENCMKQINYILNTESNIIYELTLLPVIRYNLIYNYENLLIDDVEELKSILFKFCEKYYQNGDEKLLQTHLQCYALLLAIQFDENIFNQLLSYQNPCYLIEAVQIILEEKYIDIAKRNIIRILLISNFETINTAFLSREKYDEWIFKVIYYIAKIFPHNLLFESNLLQQLFDHFNENINQALTCLEVFVFNRPEFADYLNVYNNSILQLLLHFSATSPSIVSFLAYYIVRYQTSIEFTELVANSLEIIKQFNWIQADNNGEYWEAWDEILLHYAVNQKIIPKEQLISIFNSFAQNISRGISDNDLFDKHCKACINHIYSLIPQEIIDIVLNFPFSSEKIFLLTFCVNRSSFWILDILPDIIETIKQRKLEEEYCALATFFARLLFFMPENEDLFFEFCSFVEFAFQADSYAVLYATVSALKYLSLRRYKLFSINELTLLNFVNNFAKSLKPDQFGDIVAKKTFQIIGEASRFEDCRVSFSKMLSTLANNILQFLTHHYSAIIFDVNKTNIINDFDDFEMRENENRAVENLFNDNELRDEEFHIDDILQNVEKSSDEKVEIYQIKEGEEGEFVKQLLNGFELLAIAAESNQFLSVFMCAAVMPMLYEFIDSIKIVKDDMFVVLTEVYKLLERLFLASNLPFDEVKESFTGFIIVAFRRPEFAYQCCHLLNSLLSKYEEVQFYLLDSFEQIILPNIVEVTEASHIVLQFMRRCYFWAAQIQFPINLVLHYKEFELHNIPYLLEFISETMRRGLPHFVVDVLNNHGYDIVSAVLEMMTDPIYNRYTRQAIESFRSIIQESAHNDFNKETIIDIINQKLISLVPFQENAIPGFVNQIIENFEDQKAFISLCTEFLRASHIYIGDLNVMESEINEDDEIDLDLEENLTPEDDDEANWDFFVPEKIDRTKFFKPKEPEIVEEEEEDKYEQIYWFGGFMIGKSPFLEEPQDQE